MISLWRFAIVGSHLASVGSIVAIGMTIAMIVSTPAGARVADDPPIDPAAITFATALLHAPDEAARAAMLDARAAEVTAELRRAIATLGWPARSR